MIVHKIRKFCSECQSGTIRRVHRGFLQKYILRQKPKYKCGYCQNIFFTPLLEKELENVVKIGVDKPTEYEEMEIIVEKF